MKSQASLLLFVTVAMLGIGPIALVPEVAQAASKQAQRAEVRKVADQTLQRLYKL